MPELMSFDRHAFATRVRRLRGNYPRNYWAEKFGLNHRALQDLEQGRVNPSRAVVMLITAIECDPDFMREIAREAKADLTGLDGRGRPTAGRPQ